MNKLFWLFGISMLPIIEMRGSVPAAAAMGLPFWEAFFICLAGNLLPIPFLILFSKKVVIWCAQLPKIGHYFQKIIDKADKHAKELGKYQVMGLFLFVLTPLPGTGAWMGSLVAALLRMRLVPSCIAIAIAVIISGLAIGAVSYGVVNLGEFVTGLIMS